MSRIFFGKNGKKYAVDDKPFASGGEGEVYDVVGDVNSVAKIYKPVKFRPDKYISNPREYMQEKIETMLDQPVNPYINGVLCVAWPIDVLFDSNGLFSGYIMPRVGAQKSILTGENERKREDFFSNYTFRHSVVMSYNLAFLVETVHSSGAWIGDFNPQNFLLNNDGTITVVDADSFDIRNKKTGKIYKCSVGVPEMLPPELQGKNLKNPNSCFDKSTDYFALAVHIFILLMNNRHPFTVKMPQNTRSSQAGTKLENNIVEGRCPYTTNSKWKNNTPPGALDVMMLPGYVRNLIDRAFTYDAQNAISKQVIDSRPSAREWKEAMSRMIRDIDSNKVYEVCKTYKSHIYMQSYGVCPFCARKNISHHNTYNAPITQIPLVAQQIPRAVVGTNGVVRRSVCPLWIFSILFGIISGVILSPVFQMWTYGFFDFDISLTTVQMIMGVIGIIAGIGVSYYLGEKYKTISNGVLALTLSLFAPLGTFVGGIAVMIVITLLVILIYILIAAFIIGLIIAILSGG